ncbi:MAG: anti-sigma factor family protein [Kangiellaceae bacterium]
MITDENQKISDKKFELLSGYLDGELTQQEAQKVMLWLENDDEYKQLHEELLSMRHEVQSLSLQDSELEHLDRLFNEPVVKSSRILGFILISTSATILVGFILFYIFTNPAISLAVKIGVALMGGGSLLLLISVLRQKMLNTNNEKYNRLKI